MSKDNLSSLDLEVYDLDDPELIRIVKLIDKLRTKELKPEDLVKEDAEIIADILSKI